MLYILILITILGWGVGAIFTKMANDHMHPMMVTTMVTIMYVILTPLAFLTLKFDKTFTWTGAGAALLSGMCVAAGSIAYFFALKRGGAGYITTMTSLYPALTLAISMLFFKEELSLRKGIGIALALISFLVLSGSK